MAQISGLFSQRNRMTSSKDTPSLMEALPLTYRLLSSIRSCQGVASRRSGQPAEIHSNASESPVPGRAHTPWRRHRPFREVSPKESRISDNGIALNPSFMLARTSSGTPLSSSRFRYQCSSSSSIHLRELSESTTKTKASDPFKRYLKRRVNRWRKTSLLPVPPLNRSLSHRHGRGEWPLTPQALK
jgi:hypothetical protein